jgi:hypothetical protein
VQQVSVVWRCLTALDAKRQQGGSKATGALGVRMHMGKMRGGMNAPH